MTGALTIAPVTIDHDFAPGDDLATIVCDALADLTWPDGATGVQRGDVVVVTSKIVAKVEGRIVHADSRDEVIAQQAQRIVATKHTPRGITQIVQTSHGLVLAAAGVDASNTAAGTVVLLPEDSDASAERLRASLQSCLGVELAVLVTDTMGRPWRLGVTDVAIGSSGLAVLDDHTGRIDPYGNTLEMTVVAVADEIAGAVDLATGKLGGAPLAVVRGLAGYLTDDPVRAVDVVRPLEEDLFWLGTAEAMQQGAKDAIARRRTIRTFTDETVDRAAVERAIADALLAPAPHHTEPFRFCILRADDPDNARIRTRLLDAMLEAWRRDLEGIDNKSTDEIDRRVARGDILRTAPVMIVPMVDLDAGAHTYPDARRNAAERDMFMAAGGAAVQSLMVRLAAEGLGSAWISSTMFAPGTVREQLGLGANVLPLGAIAVGHPGTPPAPRHVRDVTKFVIEPD